MAECFNMACPYCMDYQCKRTCTCDMRLDGEYVKIVRCKDCKHYDALDATRASECPVGLLDCMPNDFCSRGKQKDERGMTPKTLTSIVVVFRINGVKYGRRMNFETEVAEEHIGFTKTVLEMLMRGMKTQAVIDDYKVYDEIRQVDEE